MRNLPQPSHATSKEDLEKALTRYQYRGEACGYQANDQELNSLLGIYEQYVSSHGWPSELLKGGTLSNDLTQAVHDAYNFTQKGRKLEHIRTIVFSNVALCPICGIDPPTELDHFLPRSQFKPLAINPLNLIPTCHSCNHIKLDSFSTEPSELLIHAYLEELPDTDFIRASLTLEGPAMLVDFQIIEEVLSTELANRLSYQIARLRLNERYRREINPYLSSHAVALHALYKIKGSAGVSAFLFAQANHEAQNFHRNHWRPVLLKALAEHNAFCNGGFAEILPVSSQVITDLLGLIKHNEE